MTKEHIRPTDDTAAESPQETIYKLKVLISSLDRKLETIADISSSVHIKGRLTQSREEYESMKQALEMLERERAAVEEVLFRAIQRVNELLESAKALENVIKDNILQGAAKARGRKIPPPIAEA